MHIDLTQIILAVIALINAIISVFVVPWLKSKINVNNGTITENQAVLLKLAINTAVKAAEQIYNSEQGQQKKSYVINVLESQGYKVDSSSIDAAIEAAVLELHKELNKNV